MLRYRRYELARRFAIYYTAVAVAGGLSGLLAGLITQHLDGAHGIAGWRWLFVNLHYLFATIPLLTFTASRSLKVLGLLALASWFGTSWRITHPRLVG
jgi:MFS family permease